MGKIPETMEESVTRNSEKYQTLATEPTPRKKREKWIQWLASGTPPKLLNCLRTGEERCEPETTPYY